MKQIRSNNTNINYRVYGSGETTLLFVHGSYIDQTYWDAQVKALEQRFKVVTLDLAGHGSSGKERDNWSTESFADDLTILIQELELQNVILIGHSWGADVCLISATKNPGNIIGFIAVDYFKNAATPAAPEEQVKTIKENLRRNFKDTNENYARMALLTPKSPSFIVDRVVKDFRNAYEPMGQQVTAEIFEMFKMQEKRLPKLPFKLHLINVDYFPTNETPLRQLCEKGYKLVVIKGTSHYPMLESPERLTEEIEHTVDAILKSTMADANRF